LVEQIKRCKTVDELRKVVNRYFNSNNIRTKYSIALQNNLKRQTDFNKAQQAVWNYYLNQFNPIKSNDMKVVPYKGTAIRGLEIHSFGH